MNTSEPSPHLCPKCQAPIPEGAPAGLCPKCLMAEAAMATEPQSEVPGVPTIDEVAAAFPELEVLGMIGRGGMGVVFKVRQPRLERFAALKILPPHLAAQPDFAQRFTREARALARLGHPNIVAVYDFGEAGGFYFLLMEYVDGVNLREALGAGRFTPEQALGVVPKLCEALQYAHDEGVLHRDIKPENILLETKGRVKLVDFGIAKLAGEAVAAGSITGTGATLGTPAYMAPEQIEKPGAVDHRADIYSLGVVFYEMLTGELPLGRFAPPSRKSSVGSDIDEIVMRALEKERELRQQSATEMRTEVENAGAHGGGAVRSPSAESAPSRGWAAWKISLVMALISLPAGLLGTMLMMPMLQKGGIAMVFGFLPLVMIPFFVFVISCLVAVAYRRVRRSGAPSWVGGLICIALVLVVLGGSGVALLVVPLIAYQRARVVPPAQQQVKVSVTELGRLPATEDPGDRVSAIDIESTPGCVVEGRFFIERGEIRRELPDLEFGINSDPAWGGWKTRVKVTAEGINGPARFTRAVIGLQSNVSRGYEGAELAPWPPGGNWRPVRSRRSTSLASGDGIAWPLFETEGTALGPGEPTDAPAAKLVLRLTVVPIPPGTKLEPITFSIRGPHWRKELGLDEPTSRLKAGATVYVDVEGTASLEGQKMAATDLRGRLKQIGLGKDAAITIRASSSAPMAAVTEIVDAVEKAGLGVKLEKWDAAEPGPEKP